MNKEAFQKNSLLYIERKQKRFFPKKGDIIGWASCIAGFAGLTIGLFVIILEVAHKLLN